MESMEEKRKNIRLSIKLKVWVEFGDGSKFEGYSDNISFGGMYVAFSENVEVPSSDLCEISLILQDDEEQVDIQFKAQVAHFKSTGAGFKFIRIDIDYYERFKSLMIMNSNNPDKLIEELEISPGLIVGN